MAPTRRRSRKTQGKIDIPERVVIKTEVIDESYEQFYTTVNPVIKYESIDPSLYVVKEEPPDVANNSSSLITEIKTEPIDTPEQVLNNKNDTSCKTRNSAKGTTKSKLRGVAEKRRTDSNLNELSGGENIENLPSDLMTPQPRETRSRRQQLVNLSENKSQNGNANSKITQNGQTGAIHNDILQGCILHMRNLPKINKTFNSLQSLSSEKKKYRERVKALIPKDMRFPIGNYKCYSCDNNFKLLCEWEAHIIQFIQYKGCFPKCDSIASTTDKFKDGWTTKDNKTFLCNHCSFETKHKQDVYQHIIAKHDPQCHKCALCTKTFNTLHYLKNHLSYKHNPTRTTLHCSYCNYKTIDKYSLSTHERTKHTKEGYLKCDQCEVKTPTKYKMRLHILRAHSSDKYKKKSIKCTKCSYKTNEYKRLREHFKRSHSDDDIYSCAHCRYKGSKHYLEIHIFKMHMKDQVEKKYKCDICDKMFPSEAGLLTHNRIIHSNGPETCICKHCQLVFMTKHDCFIHTNVAHLSKPAFQCNECPFWAKDKDNLREHVFRKHRFTFYCAYCPFKTHAKLYIYLHINSKHNPNGRRFKCSKCKYVAKNKTLLNQHVNVRHNPNPILYTCFHCGHKNKIKHKLSQHMQMKHLNMFKKKKQKK